MIANIKDNLDDHLKVIGLINNETYISKIYQITTSIIECYKNGGKLIFVGNGGSFSDCLHLSAEFTGRFNFDRKPLNSIVLGSNPSSLTAISNDYGYEESFYREFEAKVNISRDILFCLTTSGNSKNILKCTEYCLKNNINHFIFSGKDGGQTKTNPNTILIPSFNTARIQEAHLLIGHIIVGEVEKNLFGNVI